MVYVALLRGINVGGNNKIDMNILKETFIRAGMHSVRTYINSGNVIFTNRESTREDIIKSLEKAIFEDFGLDIKVLIRTLDDFEKMMKKVPDFWINDKNMKCDVLFLWDEIDKEEILNELTIKPKIDTVIYVSGAILWKTDKINVTKSGLMKLAGSSLYKKMTVRNINTTRKIYEMMKELGE